MRNPQEYRYLMETLDVKTVVNLTDDDDDESSCLQYGLNCKRFPIRLLPGADSFFDWDMLRRAFDYALKSRRAGNNVFIHCSLGSDRTGALAAAIMIRKRACGKSFDRDRLWSEVEQSLRLHRFHNVYFSLHRRIRDLVFHFDENPWLCRQD